MVTNNLTSAAEASTAIRQPAQTSQSGETTDTSFSELLQSAASTTPATQSNTADSADAEVSITDGELVKSLTGILKDMLSIVKANDGKDAQGEMLQILAELMSGKSDDEENKKANELVMSVLANLVNNGVDLTADTQQPLVEQTAIGTVDFTAAQPPITAADTLPQPTSDVQGAATAQTTAPDMRQTAQSMLDSLLSYAKENLGLTNAAITTAQSAQPQTAEQLKQSFGFAYAKAADAADNAKTGELEQLVANLSENQSAREATQPSSDNATQPTQSTAQPVQTARQTEHGGMQPQQNADAQTDSGTAQSGQSRQSTENAAAADMQTVFTAETQPALQPEQAPAAAKPAEVQLTEAIADRLSQSGADNTEFTLELNPENLGRVTVKLTADSEGKIAVEITASNPETQKLLDARAENVQQSLRQNGVELEKYQVVYSADEAAYGEQSYDGSSKNPYSRQAENDSDENSSDVDFADILSSM